MKNTILSLSIILIITTSVFAQIDYSSQVQPIFDANCTSCHGGVSGVTLMGYTSTMESIGSQYGKLIVTPGDTSESPLWDKLNPSPEYGSRMPPSGSLTAQELNTISSWILEGALPVTTVQTNPESQVGFRLISCYPNPFNPSTTIQVVNETMAQIRVTVYNTLGQIVHTIADYYEAGYHDISVDLTNQPSGMYILQIQIISKDQLIASQTIKTILMK
jgi:hypothetical protein